MAVSKNISGVDQALYTGTCSVFGWTIDNTHATEVGSITFYDSATATGPILGKVRLAAGAVTTIWLGPQGLHAGTGVYVDVSATGTLSGAVYVG